MSFNEVDIFLFEKFFSSKTDSKTILGLIQIYFNLKINKANENKIDNRLYDFPYIIQNYLYYQISEKFLFKEKFSIPLDNETYSKKLISFNNLIEEIIPKLNYEKIPFKYFKSNKEDNSPNLAIFNDKNKTEFFFHVILNYYYYIIFVHDNPNYKTQHNLMPPIFKNNLKDLSSLFNSSFDKTKNDKYKKYLILFILIISLKIYI
jgi:hypothetical protein